MSTSSVVNQVISHIIKQGKDTIHDHYLNKEKVPPFSKQQAESQTQEMVIHNGFQAETPKKHSHFSLKSDKIPYNIHKDNFTCKSGHVTHKHQSFIKSPTTPSQHKIFSSKKRNRENQSISIKMSMSPRRAENPLKEKENEMIKLNLSPANRIVIERARLREENQEEVMREKKRAVLLKQYQEKLSNQAFLKEREDRQAEKEKMLESHLKKGGNFTFNFDSNGQLMLFESSKKLTSTYAPQTNYKIENCEEEAYESAQPLLKPNQFQRHKSSQFNKQFKYLKGNSFNENQRIRSARGQAFASAVMKTVNLSRISMNGSLVEIDAQQFMKRNDLFNNNHSRQTTSIPYLQPKAGTVYTEIATKQAVGSSKPHSSTTANLLKDEPDEFKEQRKQKFFEGFHMSGRHYSKTARANRNEAEPNQVKISTRPIKTAGQNTRRGSATQRRPQTSTNRGRITTANEQLVQSLLE